MSQDLTKSNITDEKWNSTQEEHSEMLSKYGWKWAVMTSTICDIYKREGSVPNGIIEQIKVSRNQIESGCYSICSIANLLREIEKDVFSILVDIAPNYTNIFLDQIHKAMVGTITEYDLNFSGVNPLPTDCRTLPCVCKD
ncbi:MAG: hypothetical protein ACXAB7_07835 [Candidatus Kariarchaeaceae archaeon]|jgi:hypothetical protein